MSCWHQESVIRPSFKELTNHLEKMLEDSVEYLDLNPRTVDNQAYFASLHALDSPCSMYFLVILSQTEKKSIVFIFRIVFLKQVLVMMLRKIVKSMV